MKISCAFAIMIVITFVFFFTIESNAHPTGKILTPWEEARKDFREVIVYEEELVEFDVVSMHNTNLPDTIVMYDNNGNMRVFVDASIVAWRQAIQAEQENPAPPTPRGFASQMAQELLKEKNPQKSGW